MCVCACICKYTTDFPAIDGPAALLIQLNYNVKIEILVAASLIHYVTTDGVVSTMCLRVLSTLRLLVATPEFLEIFCLFNLKLTLTTDKRAQSVCDSVKHNQSILSQDQVEPLKKKWTMVFCT